MAAVVTPQPGSQHARLKHWIPNLAYTTAPRRSLAVRRAAQPEVTSVPCPTEEEQSPAGKQHAVLKQQGMAPELVSQQVLMQQAGQEPQPERAAAVGRADAEEPIKVAMHCRHCGQSTSSCLDNGKDCRPSQSIARASMPCCTGMCKA